MNLTSWTRTRGRGALFAGGLAMWMLAASGVGTSFAQNAGTFVDVAQAGADFNTQGEYEGTIGEKTKFGAQVIAGGAGKFDAVLFAKGLPGGSWDGKTKVLISGATQDGTTHLSGLNFTATIADGVLSGTADGDVPFKLRRVERQSPTLGARPPEGAIVLFDGTNTDAWEDGKSIDGLLQVGTRTKRKFSSYSLHLEFRTPFMPAARGQARGNSGLYLNDQYEVQILDSFGLKGENNECGGVYKLAKPLVNMCLPPLSWQTYDVEFAAAEFDETGKKTRPATLTLRLNGVVIHGAATLNTNTPGGHETNEKKPGSIYLQDHGNPVMFRNIWLIEKK